MELTSIDYSHLLSWIAYYKFNRILNRTQMQKLLYICYGVWLGVKDSLLFTDDSPKAWPFGPVFPRVHVRYNPDIKPNYNIPENQKEYFKQHREILCLFMNVVDKLGSKSANELVNWSHQIGGPWSKTIYGADLKNTDVKWNQPIPEAFTKEFFRNWKTWLERERL